METVIRPADYYVDLHGGDMIEALVPFSLYHRTGSAPVDAASARLARLFGLDHVLVSEVGGAAYAAGAQAGVPSIIAEVGQQGIYAPMDAARHLAGLRNIMRDLRMIPGTPDPVPAVRELPGSSWLRTDVDGAWYPRVAVGQRVTEGEPVGEIRDLFGKPLKSFTAPATGVVLFLVTSLAIGAGDPLLGVGVEPLDAAGKTPR